MIAINNRMIDYYIKGLPFETRQKILKSLDDIGVMSVKCLLERPENYPKLRRMGLDDDQIKHYSNRISQEFACVNKIMVDAGRPPLFEDPYDTYESSKRCVELLVKYHRKESKKINASSNFGKDSENEAALIKKMGCTWDDYIPKSYKE
ncbi:MAG: hypothetical protein IJT84_05245 [Clostridia bacterium]|nr:hypothetical protein [Clostridia bacterium]